MDIIRSLNQMNNQKTICLNPKCPRSKQCILDSDQLKNHKNCFPWIISQTNIYIPYTSYIHPIQNQINLDFEQDGINFLKKIASLEQWPYQLERIFQQLKSYISNQIDMLKNQKILQFNQIYIQAKQAFMEITEAINKVGKDSLFIQLKKLYLLQKYTSINLCQVDKMKHFMDKSVKECLSSLGNLVQSSGMTFNQVQQKSKRKALQRANNFFFQENPNSTNEKIMKLANTFQVTMAKATFDNQLSLYKTNCWICDKVITSVKQESTRNGCLHQLFIHLTTEHYKQTYLNYMKKILRYDVEEITFQSLMGKIKTEKLKQVYVIDRENAGSIERPFEIQEGQFFIEVMNKENKNLAKGAYMLADSKRKDAADILMTIIIYQMLNHHVEKIFLVTKDHFGVTFLEVVGNMFPGKLQCIEPKQFTSRLYGSNASMESETK